MMNTYYKINLEILFVVKYRNAILDELWRDDVFDEIGNIMNDVKCKTLIVNGGSDHVHCLVELNPWISLDELTNVIKERSSRFINDRKLTKQEFEWQDWYASFSHSPEKMDTVFKFIKNQTEYHAGKTLLEEYQSQLKELNIVFDKQNSFEDLI